MIYSVIDSIIEFDKALMLHINHATTPFLDIIMPAISNRYSVIPFCVLILILIFKKNNPREAALYIIAILITFALCDSLSTHMIKNTICRFRPCHDSTISDLVRMLEYKGGKYGFVSSHAANLFGLALVSSYAIRIKWFNFTIFGWAFLVSYSRIYVGKHFPLDVICGGIFGLLIASLIIILSKFTLEKYYYFFRSQDKKISD